MSNNEKKTKQKSFKVKDKNGNPIDVHVEVNESSGTATITVGGEKMELFDVKKSTDAHVITGHYTHKWHGIIPTKLDVEFTIDPNKKPAGIKIIAKKGDKVKKEYTYIYAPGEQGLTSNWINDLNIAELLPLTTGLTPPTTDYSKPDDLTPPTTDNSKPD